MLFLKIFYDYWLELGTIWTKDKTDAYKLHCSIKNRWPHQATIFVFLWFIKIHYRFQKESNLLSLCNIVCKLTSWKLTSAAFCSGPIQLILSSYYFNHCKYFVFTLKYSFFTLHFQLGNITHIATSVEITEKVRVLSCGLLLYRMAVW